MADERLTPEELAAEGGVALPDKEAMSLLDLNAQLDLALDLAAPIDAAIAANANVAAPINGSVSANILSFDSTSSAVADQDAMIAQELDATAEANADQHAVINQAEPVEDTAGETESVTDVDDALLNLDVDLALDADIAAPVDAAVAANANVAAPIDAAVSANVGSIGSESDAISDQDVII